MKSIQLKKNDLYYLFQFFSGFALLLMNIMLIDDGLMWIFVSALAAMTVTFGVALFVRISAVAAVVEWFLFLGSCIYLSYLKVLGVPLTTAKQIVISIWFILPFITMIGGIAEPATINYLNRNKEVTK